MNWLDTYSLKARLAPALIAIIPEIALVLLVLPWSTFGAPQSGVFGAMAILFIGASDLARRFGKRIERKILKANGGQPMATTLRHRDTTVDPHLKHRYLEWLGSQLNETPPTSSDELQNTIAADQFYSRCTVFLRDRTRDKNRFNILFDENVTYGFRRNLLGLKSVTLIMNTLILTACAFIFWYETIDIVEPITLLWVAILTTMHSIYFVSAVTKDAVIEASDQYGRQLVLSTEALMDNNHIKIP